MHKLLERQIRRHLGNIDHLGAEAKAFLDAVSAAYTENDSDRALLERSLELTSQELTQRYAALRVREQELQVILDGVPAFIWFKDADNRILRVNRAGAEFVGSTPEALQGKSTYDLYPEHAARFHKDDLEVIQSGRPKLGIVEPHMSPDGTRRWVQTDKVPYRDPDGKAVGVIVFSVDITARKESEEKLREAYAKLEELVHARTQFLNTTAHELRTPLTPIILQTHLLAQSMAASPDPAQRRGFEILSRNIRRLEHLVNDVLDAARLQSGKLVLRRRAVDLTGIVSEVYESFQEAAHKAGLTLDFRPQGPLEVDGDPSRLEQVLYNLLGNAIKFTSSGGRVTLQCIPSGAHVIVTVQDTGMGIEPANISRLFQPFSQVHDTMQTTEGGTGLGLFVSKGIVEEHGGQMWCYSAGPNTGATFSFRLPLTVPRTAEPAPRRRMDAIAAES